MEVKLGYKQTEVGVVPEDWNVVEAFELEPFITSGSRGWAKYYSDHGALFMRITNLSRNSIYPNLTDQKFVNLPQNEAECLRTALQNGDILISITADIGIIGYVNASMPKPAYINQHIACLRLPPETADSLFASYYLASHGPQKRLSEMTDVGAKLGINLTTVGKLKLLCPPLSEQRAIAEALGDVDGLLSGLDRLIAKKRDVKQAAMQQLLTGQTRLPGFQGEWKQKPLEQDISLLSGHHVLAQHCNTERRGVPYITGPADFPEGRIENTKFTERPSTICEPNDILVTVKGSGSGTIVLTDRSYCISRQLMAIRVNHWNCKFLCFSLLQNAAAFKAAATGLIPGLSRSDILDQRLPLPPTLLEQTAIAEVLSDLDAELATLEQGLAKVRALKQGMVQELLTGKTRLVSPEGSHA